MALTRIDVLVMFNEGSAIVWNDVTVIVPNGAFIIDDVNKEIRKGDGVLLFADLPVVFYYGFSDAVSSAITPANSDEDMVSSAYGGQYAASTTLLSTILTSIINEQEVELQQGARYTTLESARKVSDVTSSDEGMLVMCDGGVYHPGTLTFAQLVADIIASASAGDGKMHIERLNWFSDKGLENQIPTDKALVENSTVYCKVDGFHDKSDLSGVSFGLSVGVSDNITIKNSKEQVHEAFLMGLIGGSGDDTFTATAIDTEGNVICVGYTSSEGSGVYDALVAKLDSNLTPILRVVCGGIEVDQFTGVDTDSSDNIICVGNTSSEGSGLDDALIVKFDRLLNITSSAVYGGAGTDYFTDVAVDSNDNIICVGYTDSEGAGLGDALVVKFDKSLSVLTRKVLGGASADYFRGVTTTYNDVVICVGYTASEGSGVNDALVVKFASDLSIIDSAIYGGASDDFFRGVVVDSLGNIICSGYTYSEGSGADACLVVKFNDVLTPLASKIYGGSGYDTFRAVAVDSHDNVICCGQTDTEGNGLDEALIAVFDLQLNLISSRICGGAGLDFFAGVAVAADDSVICAGHTTSDGQGGYDALVAKIPSPLPVGILTNATGLLTMSTSNLILADSALILSASTLVPIDSTIALGVSSLTKTDSLLTQTNEVIETTTHPLDEDVLLTTLFYGDGTDLFNGVAVSLSGDIYAVGSTTSSATTTIATLVKFDKNLDILSRKQFDGIAYDEFRDVAIDANGNVICVGYTDSEGQGLGDAIIVKLDSTLAVLAQKVYGGSLGIDTFNAVTTDSLGAIYCCGSSDGSALVVKFDATLIPIASQLYTGADIEQGYFNDIALDIAGNVVCVGSVYITLDLAFNGVVVKYTDALVISAHASVGVTGNNLEGVATDSLGNIFCVGWLNDGVSENSTIFKLDTNLVLIAAKEYGSDLSAPNNERFNAIQISAADEIYCFGFTTSEGAGGKDFSVVKLDTTLVSVLGNKTYGSVNDEGSTNRGVLDEVNGRIIFCGDTITPQSVNPNALICSLPIDMRTGTYTNKHLNTLVLTDGKLITKDSALLVAVNTYAATASTLSIADSVSVYGVNTNGYLQDTTLMNTVSNVFAVSIGETISRNAADSGIATRLYGGSGIDSFTGVASDSIGNLICVGYTNSEGGGLEEALIVKFDSKLAVIGRHIFGGAGSDVFNDVAVDSLDNIVCVGYTTSEGAGAEEALVVKFDSAFAIIGSKIYGGAGSDVFSAVTVDSLDNIVCVGNTTSEGLGTYAGLIVKFDGLLTILARKTYSAIGDVRLVGVVCDSLDNVVCVGADDSEGQGLSDALVLKLDALLVIVARKVYGGTGVDRFNGVAVDSLDNVICVGSTDSEGTGLNDSLIVKFSPLLGNIISRLYGAVSEDFFTEVAVDSLDRIVCVGYSDSEGTGLNDAIVIKLDSAMNVLGRKSYGGLADDYFTGVAIGLLDAVVCVGNTLPTGQIGSRALITQMPASIPAGRYFNEYFNDTICTESALELKASNLITSDSTLTLADSLLTSLDSVATLSESYLHVYPISRMITTDIDTNVLMELYGGAGSDVFRGVATDAAGNLFFAGFTTSEGAGVTDALVVKMDSSLSVVARKIYGGASDDFFGDVAVDSLGNVICVGSANSEGSGLTDALIVKFDNALVMIGGQAYGGAGSEIFGRVVIDSTDNIVCVGWSDSSGQGVVDALVVKFDALLAVIASNTFGGVGNDYFNGVAITALDGVVCVGYTDSEGAGLTDALVASFDATLALTASTIHGGAGDDAFNSVAITSLGDIVCVGSTASEGSGLTDALLVKYDSLLTSSSSVTYGGAGDESFRGVAVDASDEIVCIGYTSSEGAGVSDALLIRYTATMVVLGAKVLGGAGDDAFYSALISTAGDIVCSGSTSSEGSGVEDGLVVIFPPQIFSGGFATPAYPSLVGNDSDLIALPGTLISAANTLVLAAATLTNAASALTLSDSTSLIDIVGACTIASLTNRFTDYVQDFTVSANDGDNVVTTKIEQKAITFSSVLVGLYGGTGNDAYYGIAVDSLDHVICVGFTTSEGEGLDEALVVKMDSEMNVLYRKTYGGAAGEYFYHVTVDVDDNVICVGYTTSEGTGLEEALVVKFTPELKVLAKKGYSGALGGEYFRGVTTDSMANIICVGHTTSEGAGGGDCLVVKFDAFLNIKYRKVYGGLDYDYFNSVATDSLDNVICVGRTYSAGQGLGDAIIVKFDPALTVITSKVYGGIAYDYFWGVVIDIDDNVVCAGQTTSDGLGGYSALVVKFDSTLNLLEHQVYGGAADDNFYAIVADSMGNIICSGATSSEGAGLTDTFMVKFDKSLSLVSSKVYGGVGDDQYRGVAVDSADNIICAGLTSSEGAGLTDALLVRFPAEVPSGTFTGIALTGLTLSDSELTVATSSLVLADAVLTLSDSALTLTESALVLSNSRLTYEVEALG